MSHKTNPVLHLFYPYCVSLFQEIPLSRWTQSSITNSLQDNAEQTKTRRHTTPTRFSSVSLSPSPTEAELKPATASLHKLQLCLKSAKCFISAGQLPGQLRPGDPCAMGPLGDEGWLGREGGGSYVTKTTAGTASQRFPEEFWEHRGPTCEHEKERDGGMDAEGETSVSN